MGVVAVPGMKIEREMGGVQVDIVIEQILDMPVYGTGNAPDTVPYETVMNQKHLAFVFDRFPVRGHARVNGKPDLANLPGSLDLKTVAGGIFYVSDVEFLVEEIDYAAPFNGNSSFLSGWFLYSGNHIENLLLK